MKKGTNKKGILKSNIFDKDSYEKNNISNILRNVRKDSLVK